MNRDLRRLAAAALTIAAAGVAQAGTVFSDDFSTDPLTNGQWKDFYRQNSNPATELVWDSASGTFRLTDSVAPGAGFAWADHSLSTRYWSMDYDYRVGGGGSGDGHYFAFYASADSVNGNQTIQGYWIFFDTFQNWWDPYAGYIGLAERLTPTTQVPIHTPLVSVPDTRVEDDQWHHVQVLFEDTRVRLFVDDMTTAVIDHAISGFDGSRSGLAFGGLGNNNYHIIDNVRLTDLGAPAVPLPTSSHMGLAVLCALAGVARARRRAALRL